MPNEPTIQERLQTLWERHRSLRQCRGSGHDDMKEIMRQLDVAVKEAVDRIAELEASDREYENQVRDMVVDYEYVVKLKDELEAEIGRKDAVFKECSTRLGIAEADGRRLEFAILEMNSMAATAGLAIRWDRDTIDAMKEQRDEGG